MDTIDTCCYRPGRFLAPNWLYPPFVFFPLQINLRAPWGFSPLNLSFEKSSYHFLYEWTDNPKAKIMGILRVFCPWFWHSSIRWRHCLTLCSRTRAPGGAAAAAQGWGHQRCGHGCWVSETIKAMERFHQPNSGDMGSIYGKLMEVNGIPWWYITTNFQEFNIKPLKFTGFRCGVRNQTWWFSQNDDVTLNSINTWGFISQGFPLWKNCSWR